MGSKWRGNFNSLEWGLSCCIYSHVIAAAEAIVSPGNIFVLIESAQYSYIILDMALVLSLDKEHCLKFGIEFSAISGPTGLMGYIMGIYFGMVNL